PIGEPSLDAAPELSTFDEAPSSADERSSLAAKAAGALSGLKTRFYGPASDRALHREDGAAHKTTSPGPLGILAGLRSNPLTAALIVAVALAIAAVFFLIKDLLFAGVDPATVAQRPAVSAPAPMAPTSKPDVDNKGAEPATSGETIKPRALYLNSVAELKTAKTAAETSAAIAGIEQAAELGWPPAQLQLGELYKLGQGVPEDPAKARTWYERAANGGNVLAMHRAGVMEARGQGGPRDEAAAIAWFEKAGNFGLVDSQYNLGALYHPGGDNSRSGVQDAAKAYYWYSLAAKNGDQQAGALAASLASSLSPERLKAIDADIATWKATQPDADANEVAPAS
ncbi:MAG TPA: tetratricopeptide repeat protein, partial [Parvularculaceae bacterium]|nr:tetratricopeptide repeat protein [Parvularculaceae bacterium]